MVACLLYLRSSSAAPLLSLCTKLEPNSMQIRTGSAILSTLVRVWFEFASSLQRIYSGGTAEDEQRYSRLTSDLLLTYGREKSRYFITNPEKKNIPTYSYTWNCRDIIWIYPWDCVSFKSLSAFGWTHTSPLTSDADVPMHTFLESAVQKRLCNSVHHSMTGLRCQNMPRSVLMLRCRHRS